MDGLGAVVLFKKIDITLYFLAFAGSFSIVTTGDN